MLDVVFVISAVLAAISVGGISLILLGIAMGKISV